MFKFAKFFIAVSIILNVFAQKPRIAIVSLYDAGYKHIGQYSDLNKRDYAKKHGYHLFLYHELLDPSRPAAWSKILALEKHLDNYDWLFWSDADSLVMNKNIKLESLIDNNYDMVIGQQASSKTINTGSFLIKNSQWSKQLLKDIYSQVQFLNHPWWEQAAFIHLYEANKDNFKSHVKLIHQRYLNSHILEAGGIYKPGDFVIHFYGWAGLGRKDLLMQKFYQLSLIKQNK